MAEILKLNPLIQAPLTEKKPQVTEQKFREAAEMYEKHFIRQMMKEMRSTVKESGFIKQNNAEKIFRDQLDDQYADDWGKSGGIGLADMIHSQLMDRYGTQLDLKEKIEKPSGPIDLTVKSNLTTLRGTGAGNENTGNATHLKIEIDPAANSENKPAELKNPWAGTLLDKKYLEMDQMQYRIKHDNGFESLILTRGTGLATNGQSDRNLSVGDEIKTGQQLGWVDAKSPVFWTIKPDTRTDVSE